MEQLIIDMSIRIKAKVKKKGSYFVAQCPALDLFSQGDTRSEAKENMKEAAGLFLISCIERGTLNQVLKECGFSVVKTEVDLVAKNDDEEEIEIPLHLLSQYKESGQCHHA
jgi:predicted RNase H-like HicB family nuclease